MCSTLLRFSHRCYQMWSKFLRDQILVDQINCSRLIALLPSKLWGLWRERSDLVHPGGRKEMGAIKSCAVIPHDSTDLYRIAFNHNLTFLPPCKLTLNLSIFQICRDLHLQFLIACVCSFKNHRPWCQRSAHPVNHEKPSGSAKLSLPNGATFQSVTWRDEYHRRTRLYKTISNSRRAKCPAAQAKTDIAVACSKRQCVAISDPESIICP